MHKTFKQLGYKPGERVRCIISRRHHLYQPGEILEIYEDLVMEDRILGRKLSNPQRAGFSGLYGDWELVTNDDAEAVSRAIILLSSKGYTITEPERIGVTVHNAREFINNIKVDRLTAENETITEFTFNEILKKHADHFGADAPLSAQTIWKAHDMLRNGR